MHRRNRTVGSAYDTALSAMESTALPEIAAKPGILISELQHRLHLNQVGASRLVQGLRIRALISELRPRDDKRRKALYLTTAGEAEFSKSATRAHATFASAIERVAPDDRERFLNLLALFNDGLGARDAAVLESDPQGMREVRRLSRVLGALGTSVFNQPCSALEWHTFDLVHTSPASLRVSTIAESLGTPVQTVTGLIKRLTESNLVAIKDDPRDRRCKTVHLTPAGSAVYYARRKAAEGMLLEGLRAISQADRAAFVELFKHWAGDDLAESVTVLSPSLHIQRVFASHELVELRSFVLWERCRQGLYRTRTSSLLTDTDAVYSVRLHRRLIAVVCISATLTADTGRISHLIWCNEDEITAHVAAATPRIIDQHFSTSECTNTIVEECDVSIVARNILRSHPRISLLEEYVSTSEKKGRGTREE